MAARPSSRQESEVSGSLAGHRASRHTAATTHTNGGPHGGPCPVHHPREPEGRASGAVHRHNCRTPRDGWLQRWGTNTRAPGGRRPRSAARGSRYVVSACPVPISVCNVHDPTGASSLETTCLVSHGGCSAGGSLQPSACSSLGGSQLCRVCYVCMPRRRVRQRRSQRRS